MTDSETRAFFQKLDKVCEAVIRMEEKQGSIAAEVSDIKSIQRLMSVNGCEIGRKHERDITEIKERPAKIIGAMAVISGFVSVVTGFITWMIMISTTGHAK
jgi:hypothetical protein